jgi:hypothetical protein
MTAERFHVLSQLEHLQSKYVGTGHPDTSRWEFVTNHHRDTYASYVGKVFFNTFTSMHLTFRSSGHSQYDGCM